MKVLIGITADTEEGVKLGLVGRKDKVVYLWNSYVEAVREAGGTPVILPPAGEGAFICGLAERLDGLLLSGGPFDVPPEFYGEKPRPGLRELKPERSRFERALLRAMLRRGRPVLGICGGMQLLNVVLGGTLFQDLRQERPATGEHEQPPPRDRAWHEVRVRPGTLLYRLVSRGRKGPVALQVNSTHHQAVKDLGRGLVVSALASDSVVEAVESVRHEFVVGVQWHPELLYAGEPAAARLFRAFIRAAAAR